LNIFEIIGHERPQAEPIHSRFLAEALQESVNSDGGLFDRFWEKAAPSDWAVPATAKVCANDRLYTYGAIDFTILPTDTDRVLGVEVKTVERSTKAGQLSQYRKGLEAKYPSRELAMCYLTPFSRVRAEQFRGSTTGEWLPPQSVREYENFTAEFSRCTHLSWLDVAEIDWNGGELWEQHCDYVRNHISSPSSLNTTQELQRFSSFFEEHVADRFFEALSTEAGEPDGFIYDLANVEDPAAFASVFRILIDSDAVTQGNKKTDRFDVKVRQRYLDGPQADVHREIFALAKRYNSVWLDGLGSYGLRVTLRKKPSFSLATFFQDGRYVKIGPPKLAKP